MDNKTNEKTSEIEKALKRGVFKDQYIVYCRKSTDEANSQKNSLVYQAKEIDRHLKRVHLPVTDISLPLFSKKGIISEKHSAYKESKELNITKSGKVEYRIERPKFQRLIWHLNQGHFKGVICLCWDRISRNSGDDTIIKKLRNNGVDFRFVLTEYQNTSSGDLHMDIDSMFSTNHSRVTSEKVTAAMRSHRDDGKWTHRAPIGYLNIGTVENKPQDPKRAPIIKELFELYATGDWCLSDLKRFAAKQGLKSTPNRRKRSKEEIMADDSDESNLHPKICHLQGIQRGNRIHPCRPGVKWITQTSQHFAGLFTTSLFSFLSNLIHIESQDF